ncbi:carotenoid oxygenase family protein [Microcoleus vaginatus]|uniref:carotenoid oxygenase family protein n=1 Tax=Microcoleus vaginatus TaxID=119532 RepID=UPI00403F9FC5
MPTWAKIAIPQSPSTFQIFSRDKGWIVTVIYDGNSDSSEVWIFDSDGLSREPVCKLELPGVIPLGFHGTWKSAV